MATQEWFDNLKKSEESNWDIIFGDMPNNILTTNDYGVIIKHVHKHISEFENLLLLKIKERNAEQIK